MTLRFQVLACVLLSAVGHATQRAKNGGVLRIAFSRGAPEEGPSFADSPGELAHRVLGELPGCRLDALGRPLPVALEPVQASAEGFLSLSVRRRPEGAPAETLSRSDLSGRLQELMASDSPYRGLFASLRGENGQLTLDAVDARTIRMRSAFPWPDLATALCHPAFWFGATRWPNGPFRRIGEGGEANPEFPRGRPFVDGYRVIATHRRAALRLFREQRVDLHLGGSGTADRHPYVTYLALGPSARDPALRTRLASSLNRGELVRSFVRGPAVAVTQPWGGAGVEPAVDASRASSPAPATPLRELTLMFDSRNEDARDVAERLQLKLRAAGIRLVLTAHPRPELWRRWMTGQGFDLALLSVLLPPQPPNALAVLLEVAAANASPNPYRPELQALGALDDANRSNRAVERARALLPSLPLIPLYAQGLAISALGRVQGLTVDPQGIPRLEDVVLDQE